MTMISTMTASATNTVAMMAVGRNFGIGGISGRSIAMTSLSEWLVAKRIPADDAPRSPPPRSLCLQVSDGRHQQAGTLRDTPGPIRLPKRPGRSYRRQYIHNALERDP